MSFINRILSGNVNHSHSSSENINMKKILFAMLISICLLSCAGVRPEVIGVKPEPPVFIMGQGNVSAEKMAQFLLLNNSGFGSDNAQMISRLYMEEASFEGVNHDIAFIQMCLETGFLRYGGDVKPEQFNFAGLGAIGNGEPGLSFPDRRTGIRAHIQHLKAYGSREPLNLELVNPRFRFVQRGRAPTYEGLAGTWAADPEYAVKINALLQRLYDYAF